MSREPTVEELIALASKPKEKTTEEVKEASVKDFIVSFELANGEYKIFRKFLYGIYCKWTKTPKTRNAFYAEMEKYFTSVKPVNNSYYLLNKSTREIAKMSLYLED